MLSFFGISWLISGGHPALILAQGIGANNASIFINLTAVFTALIAVMLLHETLHSYHIVGGVMVLLGVVMAQRTRMKWKQTVNKKAFSPMI